MQVAQLTFNTYNNYGNILQKYALHAMLKKFVDFTEVLWFNGNKGSSDFWAETAEVPPSNLKSNLREAVKMTKFKEFHERYIKTSFQHISVRENNAVDIVKNLTGRDAELVLDPVLLLTADEWQKVSRRPSWLNEKYQRGYILTYFFKYRPVDDIKKLSKKFNLPVINLFDENNFNHYITSPDEFIYLFANASLVFTHSFHGTAFSILFKKPFLFYNKDNWINSIMERIISLLKMFNLENRILTSQTDSKFDLPFEIDFSVRDKILPQERLKALNFLVTALNSQRR